MAVLRSFTVVATLLLGGCLGTEKSVPDARPLVLRNDFEDGQAPVLKPLVANGKFTINSMGVTSDKAFTGVKSLKFEVTAESGNYYTWLIPFEAPAEGRLRLSCRYRFSTTGKGKFGPGVQLRYPAIASACGPDFFDWKNSTDGGWTWLDIDLEAFARNRVANRGWEIRPEQVVATVEGMVLCLNSMAPGERATLYIDDLVVEGGAGELSAELEREAIERWRPVKERHAAALQRMRREIDADSRFLAARSDLSPAAKLLQQTTQARLAEWSAMEQAASKRGYLTSKEAEDARRLEERINNLMANVAMLEGHRQ